MVKDERNFRHDPITKTNVEDLQIRNYAPTTVAAYIRSVAEFAKHFGKSPELLGSEQIREYQLYLVKEKGVSLPSYIQAVCALRFLYSNTLHLPISVDRIPLPRYERKLPVILSPAEVKLLLGAFNPKSDSAEVAWRRNTAGVEKSRSPACLAVFAPVLGLRRPSEAHTSSLTAFDAESDFNVPAPNSKLPRSKFEGFRHGLLGSAIQEGKLRPVTGGDQISEGRARKPDSAHSGFRFQQ